jgi:magnesium transporter
MISIWKQERNQLVEINQPTKYCWFNVIDPTAEEINTLKNKFEVPDYFIRDVMDVDERPRSEVFERWLVLLLRIPIHEENSAVPYHTVPLGILISRHYIFTVCQKPNVVIESLLQNKFKSLDLCNRHGFVLYLFFRSAIFFSRYLKEINRQTMNIEQELEKSSKNYELIRLLNLEKSLVYFITSLKANELLIEKLKRSKFAHDTEVDEDLVEDAQIETRQALEMANIYSNILSGLMDAFASVISNNLNQTMKQLTSITLILMLPTLVASIYGMNVKIPFEDNPNAFWMIVTVAGVLAFVSGYFFRKKDYF